MSNLTNTEGSIHVVLSSSTNKDDGYGTVLSTGGSLIQRAAQDSANPRDIYVYAAPEVTDALVTRLRAAQGVESVTPPTAIQRVESTAQQVATASQQPQTVTASVVNDTTGVMPSYAFTLPVWGWALIAAGTLGLGVGIYYAGKASGKSEAGV